MYTLVFELLKREKHQFIIHSIIDSAHHLGYLIIAEFVESR